MELGPHVARLRSQIAEALAPAGSTAEVADGDALARGLAELPAALDAALWLSLLEVLSEAAEELSGQLGPGTVEVRLKGRSPQLVLVPLAAVAGADPGVPPGPAADQTADRATLDPSVGGAGDDESDDGAIARVNLRLPEGLKRQAELAARRHRSSLNAWLVGVVADAVAGAGRTGRDASARGRRYTGWVR